MRADILTWDGDTTAANLQDGSGTWNTTAPDRWFNPAALPTPGYQPWNNATPDSAIFGQGGAGPYTVTLGEAITVEDITFQTAGYTIAGGGNALTLAAGSSITTTANATISASLAGTNGFTKEGTGNLTLGGGAVANTLTGTVTINAGTLTMSKTAGVNAIAGDITVAGGTLAWSASNQIADTASITVSGGSLTFNGASETFANYTQTGGTGIPNGSNSGIVTLTGTLAISGGSGMTLNSNARWSVNKVDFTGWSVTGDAILFGGNGLNRLTSLTVGSGGMTLTGQQITLNVATTTNALGAALILNGDLNASGTNLIRASGNPSAIPGAVTQIDVGSVNRNFNITAGTTTIQNGLAIVGTGGFTKTGAGTLALDTTTNGNLIAPGSITVQGGTLQWVKGGQVADTVGILVNGGVVNFNGQTETIASFTQTSSTTAGSVTGNNASLTILGELKISSGAGTGTGFTINSGAQVSANTVDLRGSNYNGSGGTSNISLLMGANTSTVLTVGTGGLLLDGQFIQMNAGSGGNRIVLNGDVTASGTNTFRMNAATLIAGAFHEIDLGGGIRTFNINGGTTSINSTGSNQGIVIVNGSLTKTGAGTLTFNGLASNTYTGLTTISQGILSMAKTAGVNAIAGDILVNGGTLSWGQNNQLADTTNITVTSGTMLFNGRSETFASYTQSGGGLPVSSTDNAGSVNITGTMRISGGNIYTVNSGGQTTVGKADFTDFTGNVLLVGGNSSSVVTTFTVGSGGLFLNGQTMTFNKGTAAGNQGSALILNGNVTASNNNTITPNGDSNGVSQIDLGTQVRTFDITSGTTTVNMNVVGTGGGINKTGAGILALNAVNSYTGKTTVSQGTLTLGASGRIDSSPWIQVDSGATLNVSAISGGYSYASAGTGVISGSGTIQGSLNIGAGKVLKPGTTSDPANIATAGDGVGTLTVTGNLTFNPSSLSTVAEFKIQSPSSSDKIDIGGSLSLDANSNIVVTFDNANPFTLGAGQSWTLIDWVGALNAAGFNPGDNNRTGNNLDGNEGNLDLPELSAGLFWQVENFTGSSSLTVSIVPEPGKALLFVFGMVGMLFRRKRQ
ncbi:beta strand repeat-containing protein [Roseimicrobium gellanilyticum]|uniref:beta strand repeat-containing protein n=1 Tax=Roseimicrobium gellanilyticum TaxID=748857 RepID=UPI00147474EA|nr:autotransporter-associated beta strand repeat-containing protein [Roseimicrobium gellanilyticum]